MAGTGNPDWKKGVSGNPNGRPVGAKNFTTKVREALEALSDGKNISYEKELITAILDNAIVKKDIQAQKLIWNYLDGMPSQSIQHSGEIITTLTDEQKEKLRKLLDDKQGSPENSIGRNTTGESLPLQ